MRKLNSCGGSGEEAGGRALKKPTVRLTFAFSLPLGGYRRWLRAMNVGA